uniref:Uncharacterized protein n=1 Tax=Triticum urartu TaxID=4572 RepID=A0A8R7Q9H3_TRIUA
MHEELLIFSPGPRRAGPSGERGRREVVLGELDLAGEVLLGPAAGEVLLGPAAGEVPSWGRRRGSLMSRKLGREEEILGGGESRRGAQGEAGRRAGGALGGDTLGEAIPMVFEFQIDRRV